jgi:hypothetical protein
MSTYEDEIRRALKAEIDAGCLREAGTSDDLFSLLRKNYPASGSKIDWKRVPGAIECAEKDRSRQTEQFVEFFGEMRVRFGLNGHVLYVGDSLTDFALAGSIGAMQRALPVLLEVPQHHYFVGPNASWCICMTMEGDMAFGCAAAPPLH